jgi:hypothetical protein
MAKKHSKRKPKHKRLWVVIGAIVAVLIFSLLYATFVMHVFSKVAICNSRFSITNNGQELKLPVCANKSLYSADNTVTKLVVIVHGDGRNATDNEVHIKKAAQKANNKNTLIIAPQFLIADDLGAPEKDSILYWSFRGWKQGDKSLKNPHNRPWQMSSYQVTDMIINHVTNSGLFPNISSVVIVGHSAGGQFVNRYAAGSVQQETIQPITYKYIIASPSSYMYFSDKRKTTLDEYEFNTPDEEQKSECPGFNSYKYGPENLNSYMQNRSLQTIINQYKSRNVTYLLGGADTNKWDSSLDKSCEANLQGKDRLERGKIYYDYIGRELGKNVYTNHKLFVINNVDHDARDIFVSNEGLTQIFE